jgi:hypothetical protein
MSGSARARTRPFGTPRSEGCSAATPFSLRCATTFGNLKTWLRGTFHGVSPKPLQRYLDEFSYRFDRRWREGELFGFVLRRVVRGRPLPYRLLVAEGTA